MLEARKKQAIAQNDFAEASRIRDLLHASRTSAGEVQIDESDESTKQFQAEPQNETMPLEPSNVEACRQELHRMKNEAVQNYLQQSL